MPFPLSLRHVAGLLASAFLASGFAATAMAQDTAADANNPLARMQALNLQNYYVGNLTEVDRSANAFFLRYARPVSLGQTDWLMRATLPVTSNPTFPDGRETGLGDFSVFATMLIDTGNPAVSFGLGPMLVAPTANDEALGQGKWQLGLANVLFNGTSKRVQWGYLLTWQTDVAGDDDRADVSLGVFQPFGMLQLGQGWYARSTGAWTYDFETDNYAIPLGMGIGRVIPTESIVYNAYVEPQYSVATHGPGQPEWQVLFGLNLQFPG